ncbi:MAG TPA: hypothetical protein VHU87_11825 [Rhizomicrobium sp.]|jgi:hypothetical protein|nr:hypothetical protein [Rhizomicrobium sp.]
MGSALQAIRTFLRGGAGLSLGAALAAILLAGGGFLAGRATAPVAAHSATVADTSETDSDVDDTPTVAVPASNATQDTAPARRARGGHRGEEAGAAVIAAAAKATGTKYVHRNNSDLRKEPSYASETIKKEPKGAQVQMVALSGKWAEVQDGGVRGWMRYSVLKDDPPDAPGTKRARKKKSDDSAD